MEGRYKIDDIFDRITGAFEGNVGEEFTETQYSEFFPVAEMRYKSKVPPGFADAKKGSGEDTFESKKRVYGDLIIWRQIIERSKSESRNAILITDDEKEDWWLRQTGKTICPRPELIAEFKKETGQNILIYNAYSFLNQFGERNKKLIKSESVEEIKSSNNIRMEWKYKELESENSSEKYYRNKNKYSSKNTEVYEKYRNNIVSEMNDEDYKNHLIIKIKGMNKEIEANHETILQLKQASMTEGSLDVKNEINDEIEKIKQINDLIRKRKNDILSFLNRFII
jgi:hypothetical protein